MCQTCQKIVIEEMDIQESDLQYLPFTMKKWLCIVPGCIHGTNVKDYGIAPYYWHKQKIVEVFKKKK